MLLKCFLLLFFFNFIHADFSYYRSSQCSTPRISHGRARLRQRGNFVKFTCYPRYTLMGNKYATCRNGMWDVPIPVCVKSGCPALEEVKNALNMTSHADAWIVFFCLPGHQLVGSPVVYCDGRQWNSTAPACVDTTAKFATSCDFENPDLCGWKLDELHDFDWRRWNKKTPSSFMLTGPAYDHTYGENGTGHYMYIESTGKIENETSRLISPVYDAGLARNGCFIFYYHMYGRSMGGLRVYQKPESISMYELLTRRHNYTLFEQWGNQGNEWYSSVNMLTDFEDSFQIVVEGVRGNSFMSDLAIDDVSLQQGENCTRAMEVATTPFTEYADSCVDRCNLFDEAPSRRGCDCSIACVINENCCPDFFDVCEFFNSSYDPQSDNDTEVMPQTQKLVATTTESLPETTASSTTTTIKTTVTTLPTITGRPMTAWPYITVIRPIWRTTTVPTTSTRSPKITATTAVMPMSSTLKPRNSTRTPRIRYTTSPATATTSTTPKPTRKSTTSKSKVTPASTVLFVRTTRDKATTEDLKSEKIQQDKIVAKKNAGSSGAVVATWVVGALCACACACWAALQLWRSPRGLAARARLGARARCDSEVRYLNTHEDDDE